MWLLSERLRKSGRGSWTARAADGEWDGTTEAWPWPQWAQYLHSFDRGLTCILSGAVRGGTHDETALALAGQLAAVAWLAYFTSTMVQLVTNMNASSEMARSKIGRAPLWSSTHHRSRTADQSALLLCVGLTSAALTRPLLEQASTPSAATRASPPSSTSASRRTSSTCSSPRSSTWCAARISGGSSPGMDEQRSRHLICGTHACVGKHLNCGAHACVCVCVCVCVPGQDTNELLQELSAPLRQEVALHRCHSFLLNPKFVGILGFDAGDMARGAVSPVEQVRI